jgi:hypothetical protein
MNKKDDILTKAQIARLKETVELYDKTKRLLLMVEAYDLGQRTLLQPVNELRNAFDHIMRSFAVRLGVSDTAKKDPEYVQANLDKAYAHVYRAAYDAIDWLCVIFAERIQQELSGYSVQAIKKVLPEYYTVTKPRVMQIITQDITKLRSNKDLEPLHAKTIDAYQKLMNELSVYLGQIMEAKLGLINYETQLRRSRRRQVLALVMVAIASALITFAISFLIALWPH